MTERVSLLFEREGLTPRTIAAFQRVVYEHYFRHGRTFPWRETSDPYRILVSEFMLQQTQTSRVTGKYEDFVSAFPDLLSLARAPLRDVLQVWQGLGYNRRAIALHRTAQTVVSAFGGQLPPSPTELIQLPGIGRYTACAVAALAFNEPTVVVDTNVRTVFLHVFFRGRDRVTDREVEPLVEATLDRASPREWYYALFDFGAMLKRRRESGTRSAHYRKQGPFRGSNRELRSQIIRLLLDRPQISEDEIVARLDRGAARIRVNLHRLQAEGFVTVEGGRVTIAEGS